MFRISSVFPRCLCQKTLTRRTYHWIKSVAGLELKALSPYFFSKLQITYTAFSVKLMCKNLWSKIDHLYRVTTIFWSHFVYLCWESLSDNLDPPWYQVLMTYCNISELKEYLKPFCKLLFLKFIHFPSEFDRGPTTRHQKLPAYSVIYLLNICQWKRSLNSSVFSRQTQSENDSCRIFGFLACLIQNKHSVGEHDYGIRRVRLSCCFLRIWWAQQQIKLENWRTLVMWRPILVCWALPRQRNARWYPASCPPASASVHLT